MLEEPLLAPDPTTVSTERTIGTDDAMTRDDEGQVVHAVRAADGATAIGATQLVGHLGIRLCLTRWDGQQVMPHTLLPTRTSEDQRHIEGQLVACEISTKLSRKGVERLGGAWDYRIVQVLSEREQFAFKPASIDEIEHMQAVIVRERQHGSERRVEPAGEETVSVLGLAGWNPEHLRECGTERTGRFKPTVELDVEEIAPVAYITERETHSTSTMIRMKCHSRIGFELPTRG